MEIKQFKITRGATVNLGNYESARVDLELTFTAGETNMDDIVPMDVDLRKWLGDQVRSIQEAAGLPPHPVERFTGGEE